MVSLWRKLLSSLSYLPPCCSIFFSTPGKVIITENWLQLTCLSSQKFKRKYLLSLDSSYVTKRKNLWKKPTRSWFQLSDSVLFSSCNFFTSFSSSFFFCSDSKPAFAATPRAANSACNFWISFSFAVFSYATIKRRTNCTIHFIADHYFWALTPFFPHMDFDYLFSDLALDTLNVVIWSRFCTLILLGLDFDSILLFKKISSESTFTIALQNKLIWLLFAYRNLAKEKTNKLNKTKKFIFTTFSRALAFSSCLRKFSSFFLFFAWESSNFFISSWTSFSCFFNNFWNTKVIMYKRN